MIIFFNFISMLLIVFYIYLYFLGGVIVIVWVVNFLLKYLVFVLDVIWGLNGGISCKKKERIVNRF